MTPGNAWTGRQVAIVGGDEREIEIARLAGAAGARASVFGLPSGVDHVPGMSLAQSAAEACRDASILLLPLPGMTGDEVFAPRAKEPVVVDREVLVKLAPGALVVSGTLPESLLANLTALGLRSIAYEHDGDGRVERAGAIAEGALARIVAGTDRTVKGSEIMILGFGVIGEAVADILRRIGARICVATRRQEQLAAAASAGHMVCPLAEIGARVGSLDVLVSAATARVVGRDILDRLPAHCVVFDLVSPPGSVDREAAGASGRKVIWARGLGSTSPVTVGRAQWATITRLVEAQGR